MKPGKLRPIAVCAFVNDKKQIQIPEGFNHVWKEAFYRQLRGKIEFGKLVTHTVRRELVDCRFYDPMTEKSENDNPPQYPDGILVMQKVS